MYVERFENPINQYSTIKHDNIRLDNYKYYMIYKK